MIYKVHRQRELTAYVFTCYNGGTMKHKESKGENDEKRKIQQA